MRQDVKVVEGGKVVLPARFRRALGIKAGDTVTVELKGDELSIRSLGAWVARVQAIARKYKAADGRSVVDEFIAEKRAEAARENTAP